jgi:hypothetical protein
LAAQAGVAQDSVPIAGKSWMSAPRHSAGIATDPVQFIDDAIVQVDAAPTYGWRGFLAHIGRQVPALKPDLPANAIGKDGRPLTDPIGLSSSGSGLPISLLGLLGLSVGLQEGLEFNVLGLNFGLDFKPPALRLPFWGRLGFKEVATPDPAPGSEQALADL